MKRPLSDLGSIVAELESGGRARVATFEEVRGVVDQYQAQMNAKIRAMVEHAKTFCPRHGFARAACPGCASDLAKAYDENKRLRAELLRIKQDHDIP